MKNKFFKKILCSLLVASMVFPSLPAMTAQANTVDLTDGLKDYWNFENATAESTSVYSNNDTEATLNGNNLSVVESDSDTFGKVLRFGSGTGNFMRIANYINTGAGATSFSMWYRYDTSITGDIDSASAVLLQREDGNGATGRTLLSLRADGKYHTYINATDVLSTAAAPKGNWQNITVTFNQDTGNVKYYINGVLDSTQNMGSNKSNAVLNLLLGCHKNLSNTNPHPMRGEVDEFYVYEKELSDAEAKALYDLKASEIVVPEPDTAIDLTIDANELERTIDSDSIFGINHRYAFNGYGSFDSKEMKVKDDFKELYEEAGFGSIRYPGGTISNLFNWKATLGPTEARKKQIHGFYNNPNQGGIAPNFGIGEIATFADSVDSEIVYVYSLGRGNAQDAADLIEYLNAKVGTNPNGGIDWAAVRAENGHPAPYNVRYFEIGNEMQQVYSDGTTSQGYWLHGVGDKEAGYIDGGLASFTQQYAVCEEDWNQVASRSDGSENMVRYMRYANVNPKMYDENGDIVDDPNFVAVNKDSVHVYVGSTEWTIVDSFENSGASDQHVVVDYSTGAIIFGDGEHGKIPASGTQINVSYSVERDGFIEISKALKETTDAINEAEGTTYEAYVYSSYETQGYLDKMAARNANEWYDGLTIHPYSGTPSGSGEAFYDSAMSLAESSGIRKVQNYVNMLPEGKVPVISEYGIYNSTNTLLRSQTHAVYIAKVLMEYVRLGSPYIQKHCLIDWYSSGGDSLGPTQQAVIQAVSGADANRTTGEGTFTFFSTPSAHVFQMLNAGFGDYIISSEFDSTPTMSNGVKTISALASKDNDGNIYVAIVNANREDAYTVTLNLENVVAEEVSVSAQLLSPDTYDAANTPENPDNVVVETSGFATSTDNFTYTVPKHSFAILKIASVAQPTVDKAELAKVIASADVLVAENFTEESWVPFATALDAAKAINDNADVSQTEVEAALTNLQAAVSNLVAGQNANKTKLASLLEECEGLDADTYTEETWTAFQTTLNAAKAINDDADASQGEVNGAVIALKAAKEALIEKGSDPTDDSNDIDVSKITYTAGSTQQNTGVNYEGGIELAYDNNAGTHWHSEWNPTWYGTDNCADHLWVQFDLDEPTVVDAIRYLPRSASSRNGDITGYLVEAKTSENGEWITLTEGTWTSTGQEWKLARFDATEVVALRLVATATTADSAQNKFASAAELRVRAAESSETPDVPTVNKAELAAAIAEAEAIEADGYTEESYATLQLAITVAKAVNTNDDATQSDVDKAVEDLNAAIDALEEEKAAPVNPFEDVYESDYYYDPVLWAVENSITDGWTDTTFAPNMGCTRGQVVTFIWRAAGKPEAKNAENPFDDVYESDYYYDAVLWAVEEGITDGWTDTTFAPEMTCTRGQIVTFIWRAAGEPVPESDVNPFDDVYESNYYYNPILWAVEEGITDGWTDTTFAPEMTCTRGQVVTFLYRFFNPAE